MKRFKIFAFSGQGAFDFERARRLRELPTFSRALATVGEAFELELDALLWGPDAADLRTRNDLLQAALFGFGWSLFQALDLGIDGDLGFVGHSLGEITAMACAGALPLADAARFVRLRGALMQDTASASPQDMLIVRGVDLSELQSRARQHGVYIAGDNGGGQIVVSGHVGPLAAFCDDLAACGILCQRLDTRVGFHSPCVEPAEKALRRLLPCLRIKPPIHRFFSVLADRFVEDPDEIRALMGVHATAPVRWRSAMHTLCALGSGTPAEIVEIGARPVLSPFWRTECPGISVLQGVSVALSRQGACQHA